ncbi:14660_t:CDS:2 [Ambispora leptoticha]|uniref:14660_t:CDS:1 n=1 Tax=Ambispora leptoticha TaxID=144679 RepID=A0A9N9AP69_9GLOM|nr:14660_t:CDS:2 [Ambispora leptoticha]
MLPTVSENHETHYQQQQQNPQASPSSSNSRQRSINENSRHVYRGIQGTISRSKSVSVPAEYGVPYTVAIREPRSLNRSASNKASSNDEREITENVINFAPSQAPQVSVIVSLGEEREGTRNKHRKHCAPGCTRFCLCIPLSYGVYFISWIWTLHGLWLLLVTGLTMHEREKNGIPKPILILLILIEAITLLLAVFGLVATYTLVIIFQLIRSSVNTFKC